MWWAKAGVPACETLWIQNVTFSWRFREALQFVLLIFILSSRDFVSSDRRNGVRRSRAGATNQHT